MTRHYSTVCHERQLPVLLASMRRHCGDFRLHVLCWDFDGHDTGIVGNDVEFWPREMFLHAHPELDPIRLPGPPRSPVDTVATVRWAYFADVMESNGEPLTWLDGDIHFFSSPEPLYDELTAAGARFAVSPHRIPPRAAGHPGVCHETHAQYGLFNAGLGWAADPAPLLEMAEATRAWSYTEVRPHPDDGLPDFGDQGALERIACQRGAHVIEHPGVNLAPWNVHRAHLRSFTPPGGPPLPASYPVVGHPQQPVIAYHFSSLRLNAAGDVVQMANPCYEISPWQAAVLYEPYLAAVRAAAAG